MQQFGAEAAFKRQLLFSEVGVLNEILGYLKKSLGLIDAEVLTADEALAKSEAGSPGYNKMIIESSEPGTPAFEFRNVDV
jgi:leucyl-tRNA synthetase